jgi:hypothetical protein
LFLNIIFLHLICRSCYNRSNTQTAAFVRAYSTRSEYRKRAFALNTKCSPATPFLLDLPDAKLLLNQSVSAFVNSNQPAGEESSRSSVALKHEGVLPYLDCSQFFAAFVVETDDTRVILREITHGQTFVVRASFSLILNISDLSRLNGTLLFDSFFENVMDSLMDAFKHVVSARVAFALSRESLYGMHSKIGHTVFTSSAFLVAFNCSTSPSFDVWSSLAISLVHSKSMSPAIKNLVSLQTLQA